MMIPALPIVETVDYLQESSMTFLKLFKTYIIYVYIYNISRRLPSCSLIPDRSSDKDNVCDVKVINVAIRDTIVKKFNGIMRWRFNLSSVEDGIIVVLCVQAS